MHRLTVYRFQKKPHKVYMKFASFAYMNIFIQTVMLPTYRSCWSVAFSRHHIAHVIWDICKETANIFKLHRLLLDKVTCILKCSNRATFDIMFIFNQLLWFHPLWTRVLYALRKSVVLWQGSIFLYIRPSASWSLQWVWHINIYFLYQLFLILAIGLAADYIWAYWPNYPNFSHSWCLSLSESLKL